MPGGPGGMPGGFSFQSFGGGGGRGGGFRPGNAHDIVSQLVGGMGFGMGDDDDDGGHGHPGFSFASSGPGGFARSSTQQRRAPAKAPPVQFDVGLTLDELYTGTTKKMKVTRKRRGENESKVLELKVSPGWKEGTKITFANEGDEVVGGEAGDVVFIIKEKPHPTLRRDKNDIHCTLRVTLTEALCGFRKTITGLAGKTFTIDTATSKEVVHPGGSKTFWGDGMPHKAGRGNFIVKYDVVFPSALSDKQRELVKQANV